MILKINWLDQNNLHSIFGSKYVYTLFGFLIISLLNFSFAVLAKKGNLQNGN